MDALTSNRVLFVHAVLLKRMVGRSVKTAASRVHYGGIHKQQLSIHPQITVRQKTNSNSILPLSDLITVLEVVRFDLCYTLESNFSRFNPNLTRQSFIDLKDEFGSEVVESSRHSERGHSRKQSFSKGVQVSDSPDDFSSIEIEARAENAEEIKGRPTSVSGDQATGIVGRKRGGDNMTPPPSLSGITDVIAEQNSEKDRMFMLEALVEARKAASIGEVPVGAVIVQEGRIIARAYNRVEAEANPTAHAEMLCIREASRIIGDWRLTDSTIYVTMEPCPMCAGALLQSRVKKVVWGARNNLLGADGSWVSLFPNNESERRDQGTCEFEKPVQHPFHKRVEVRRGILQDECSMIMRDFFRARRKGEAPSAGKKPSWLSFEIWVLFKRLVG